MSKRADARAENYKVKNYLVKQVVCPKCGALKGDKCIGSRGLRYICHKDRWVAADVHPSSGVTLEDLSS